MKVKVKTKKELMKIYQDECNGLTWSMIIDYAGKMIDVEINENRNGYKMINAPYYNWFWRNDWVFKISELHMKEIDV